MLGRAADAWGYAPSYLIGAGISILALPCLALSSRQNAPADTVEVADAQPPPSPPEPDSPGMLRSRSGGGALGLAGPGLRDTCHPRRQASLALRPGTETAKPNAPAPAI